PDGDLIRRLGSARIRFGRWFGAASGTDEGTAREVLEARCAEAIDMLAGAGIWAQRLDDPDLVRLFHSCWSRGQSARFDQDLGTCLRALPEGGAGCRCFAWKPPVTARPSSSPRQGLT